MLAAASVISAPAIILRPGWAQTGPIKVGDVQPMSGPAQIFGKAFSSALQFSIERVNAGGGVLGREVKYVLGEADPLKPEIGARRTSELLNDEKVDFITCFSSSVARLMAQQAFRLKKIFMTGGALPIEMYETEFVPTSFYCGPSTPMWSNMLARYFAQAEFKKIYLINQDYALGHTGAESFRTEFETMKRPDQQIVGDDFVPLLSTSDFAPLVSKVIASGADAVMTSNFGSDLRLLMQQGHSLGWKVRVGTYFLDDPTLTQAIGAAAVGHVAVDSYMVTIDNPMNRKFLADWHQRFPDAALFYKYPVQNCGRLFWAWQWLFDVVKKAGTLDTETVIKTWEGATFTMPSGTVQMRACDHQMLSPGYIATIRSPMDVPPDLRYYGDEIPFSGPAQEIAREDATIPPTKFWSGKCKA
jgi:branched-chain amino acid transport system substrate-binding protein